MGLILRLKYQDAVPEVVELSRFPVTLGRSSVNDVVLNDETVSARHAVIEKKGGSYLIQDLESSNGLWRDGRRELAFRISDRLEFQIGDLRVEALVDDEEGGTRAIHVEREQSRWVRLRANFRGDFAPWISLVAFLFLLDLWVRVNKGGDPVEEGVLAFVLPLLFTLPLASGFSLFKSPMAKSQVIATAVVRLMPMSQLVVASGQIIEYLAYYWGGQVAIASVFSLATGALALFGAQSAFVLARIAKQTALAIGTVLILFSVLTTLLPSLPAKHDLSGLKDRVPVLRPADSGPSRFVPTGEFLEKVDASIERLEKARPPKERPPR